MKKMSIVFFLVLVTSGCSRSQDPKTPEEYKYQVSINEQEYSKDKEYLKNEVRTLLDNGQGPFYPKRYDEKTDVLVDSIVYSPDKNKIVFFVITKNSNEKLLVTEDPKGVHYDARCFLGTKNNEDNTWKIRWFRIMNLSRFSSYGEVSATIRFRYFRNLVEIKDHNGESRYKYNIDDIRFWDGPVWEGEGMSMNLELHESP